MKVIIGAGSLLWDQALLEGGEAAVDVVLQTRLKDEKIKADFKKDKSVTTYKVFYQNHRILRL